MSSVTTIKSARDTAGEIQASGTDIQERRRHGISHGPIVDIFQIEELRTIDWHSHAGVILGALVTIDQIAKDPQLQAAYPALTMSAGALATPQIRSMASLGGSLLQRTRCWYYRHPDFTCYKKGADGCPAREGNHHFGSCFDLSPCVHPHPSTLAMTLLTYAAEVQINEDQWLPIAQVYSDGSDPTRDHQLTQSEVLTAVRLPAPVQAERAVYQRAISRAHAEWPLVEVVARVVIENNSISFARVGLGGVAHIPLHLTHVNQILEGQSISQSLVKQAAEAAIQGVSPLPMTGYKVELVRNTVASVLTELLEVNHDS